jgi:hypothetical protein
MTVVNGADARMCLNQLCQVSDIPNKAKRKLLSGPDAPPSLDLKLLVKPISL